MHITFFNLLSLNQQFHQMSKINVLNKDRVALKLKVAIENRTIDKKDIYLKQVTFRLSRIFSKLLQTKSVKKYIQPQQLQDENNNEFTDKKDEKAGCIQTFTHFVSNSPLKIVKVKIFFILNKCLVMSDIVSCMLYH